MYIYIYHQPYRTCFPVRLKMILNRSTLLPILKRFMEDKTGLVASTLLMVSKNTSILVSFWRTDFCNEDMINEMGEATQTPSPYCFY